jgi:signal transduction histidine kinase
MPTATRATRRLNPAPRLQVQRCDSGTTELSLGEGHRAPAQLLTERARIAREIHDLLARSLSALGVQIETARAVLADRADIPAAIGLLEHASHLATDGLSETRQVVHALRVDTPPLPDGLADLADRHQQDYQRAVEVSITGQPWPTQSGTTMALFRAAQEALTNAARHAPDADVSMCLHYAGTQVTLSISNSAPIPSVPIARGGSNSRGGFGLVGLGERLHLVGGTLTAGRVGEKWVVRARVPR